MKNKKLTINVSASFQEKIHNFFIYKNTLDINTESIETEQYICYLKFVGKTHDFQKKLTVSFKLIYKDTRKEIIPRKNISIFEETDVYCVFKFNSNKINYLLLIQKESLKSESPENKYNEILKNYEYRTWKKLLNLAYYTDFSIPYEKAILGITIYICNSLIKQKGLNKDILMLKQMLEYFGGDFTDEVTLIYYLNKPKNYYQLSEYIMNLAYHSLSGDNLYENEKDISELALNLIKKI